MAKTAEFRGADTLFMSFLSIAQKLTTRPQDNNNDQMRNLLHSWNLKQVDVAGDGDCLFRSVAFGLVQHGDDAIKQVLLRLGIQEGNICDICTIVRVLRNKMVEEWDQRDLYQGYLTEDLSTVSHTYLESGVYAGDAGDVSVLTLANILHLPITVFTTVPNIRP